MEKKVFIENHWVLGASGDENEKFKGGIRAKGCKASFWGDGVFHSWLLWWLYVFVYILNTAETLWKNEFNSMWTVSQPSCLNTMLKVLGMPIKK